MTRRARNLAAARYVARHATDPADARLLLEALGLIDGGRIAPDDTARHRTSASWAVRS